MSDKSAETIEDSSTVSLPATAFSDPLSVSDNFVDIIYIVILLKDNEENLLVVLDVIYLLCDRQQKEMQNAMRGNDNETLVTVS